MASHDRLDAPLLRLSSQGDALNFRDAATNIFVTGVTGGGKTSGPGRHLLHAMLKAGCGGIILCAKPGEADEIRALCAKLGRLDSLILWNGRNHGFNALGYMLARLGADGTNGAVEYIMRIIEMMRAASALPAGNGDAFWLDQLRTLLRHAIPIVSAATGMIRFEDLLAFVHSAPTSPEQMSSPEWQRQGGFFIRCFTQAAIRLDDDMGRRMVEYWRDQFAPMDMKLRGNILAGFTMLDRFNHGWLREALCGRTSLTPDLCFHGALIVLDMPRATFGEDGIVAQLLFKDAWQHCVLGRNALPPIFRERFVFCYADECQEFVAANDAAFLAMSRSSRSSTVYLTQSLPSMYAKIGGANAHDRTHHLIANMGVRIHCANSCHVTNKWASETIGKTIQHRHSHNEGSSHSRSFGMNMGEGSNEGTNSSAGGSSSYSSGSGGSSSGGGSSWSRGSSAGHSDNWGRNRGHSDSHNSGWGYSEVMDDLIPAGFFTHGLKTGGPAHGNRVSAVWHQVGKRFHASNGPALLVEFRQ